MGCTRASQCCWYEVCDGLMRRYSEQKLGGAELSIVCGVWWPVRTVWTGLVVLVTAGVVVVM